MSKLKKNNALEISEGSRRDFLKNMIHGAGAIAVGTFSVSMIAGCSDSSPAAPDNGDTGGGALTVTVDISEAANTALATVGGTLALNANVLDDQGMLLYRESQSSVLAFSRECTHQKCTIDGFVNGVSTCSCHGSQFNTSGGVVSGPASSPLTTYTTALSGDMITITA